MRKVIEKGGSVGSKDGNGKCGDDSEEELLPMVGVIVSGRETI